MNDSNFDDLTKMKKAIEYGGVKESRLPVYNSLGFPQSIPTRCAQHAWSWKDYKYVMSTQCSSVIHI